jgi:hypothetical protein
MKIKKNINPFGIIDIEEGQSVIMKKGYVTIITDDGFIPIIHQSYRMTSKEILDEIERLND